MGLKIVEEAQKFAKNEQTCAGSLSSFSYRRDKYIF
jgi:hypothetical protein